MSHRSSRQPAAEVEACPACIPRAAPEDAPSGDQRAAGEGLWLQGALHHPEAGRAAAAELHQANFQWLHRQGSDFKKVGKMTYSTGT